MISFFGVRIGAMALASAFTYYIVKFMLTMFFRISSSQIPALIWVCISLVWAGGLVITRFQFNNHNDKKGDQPGRFDFRKYVNQEKKKEQNPGPGKTLKELANNPGPGEDEKLELHDLVEGAVGSSLAGAEVSMELELPENTELEIYGQKVTVKKGKIKITPKKSEKTKLLDIFPKDKTRNR